MRNFARKRTPEVGAVNVDAAIDAAMLLIGDRVRSNGVTLKRTGDPAIAVVADRVRFEQILINLIQNACDVLDGIAEPTIEIHVEESGDRALIAVCDNGPGVPPELRGQLFTPFVTGREEGLGLGLAISRDIARDFGGDLTLAETWGGARFDLVLLRA